MRKIAIAEDHKILREGLKELLVNTHLYEVVCEAQDGLEAIRCVQKFEPELLLLDLSMPKLNGISVIKEVKQSFPKTKTLVLTMYDSEEYLLEALQLGVNGYCLKDCGRKELLAAIEKVLDGRSYVSPGMADKLISGYQNRGPVLKPPSFETVSRREKDVLKLVGEGYHNKEIAEFLFISPKTVEKHRSNIMKKLNIHTVAGLTAYAIEKGLIAHHPSY
jgi:DNA-binding NarL/FixJ family response regulator